LEESLAELFPNFLKTYSAKLTVQTLLFCAFTES